MNLVRNLGLRVLVGQLSHVLYLYELLELIDVTKDPFFGHDIFDEAVLIFSFCSVVLEGKIFPAQKLGSKL